MCFVASLQNLVMWLNDIAVKVVSFCIILGKTLNGQMHAFEKIFLSELSLKLERGKSYKLIGWNVHKDNKDNVLSVSVLIT